MKRSRRTASFVSALVFTLSVLATQTAGEVSQAPSKGPAELGASLPDYSYFTQDLSGSSMDRALAVYQHGFDVDLMDFGQAVAVGAEATVTRRIALAEDRGGPESQGDPAPMALSPDGRRVAVGRYADDSGELALLTFEGASQSMHEVPGAHAVVPLAWSPDSRYLVLVASPKAFNPYASLYFDPFEGSAWILDVQSGDLRDLEISDVSSAAFSPSGTELAVERPGVLDILGTDGSVRRSMGLPSDTILNGPNAWSPDRDLLAVTELHRDRCPWPDGAGAQERWEECVENLEVLTFVDASGAGGPVPDPIRAGVAGSGDILGWRGPEEMLLLDSFVRASDLDQASYFVTAVSLNGEEQHQLSSIAGGGNFGVGGLQLASGLVPDLRMVEGHGPINRGPWPLWASILAAAAAGLMAARLSSLTPRLLGWPRRKVRRGLRR